MSAETVERKGRGLGNLSEEEWQALLEEYYEMEEIAVKVAEEREKPATAEERGRFFTI